MALHGRAPLQQAHIRSDSSSASAVHHFSFARMLASTVLPFLGTLRAMQPYTTSSGYLEILWSDCQDA